MGTVVVRRIILGGTYEYLNHVIVQYQCRVYYKTSIPLLKPTTPWQTWRGLPHACVVGRVSIHAPPRSPPSSESHYWV